MSNLNNITKLYFSGKFEQAFNMSENIDHPYAITLQGKISSLKFQYNKAWNFFDLASKEFENVEESVPNLIRQFMLEIYRLQNSILESSIDENFIIPKSNIPNISEIILNEFPEVRFVINERNCYEGVLNLHSKNNFKALSLFNNIISENYQHKIPLLANLGQTAAEYNLNKNSPNFENYLIFSNLAINSKISPLEKLIGLAHLYQFNKFSNNNENANNYKNLIAKIKCPSETKDLFMQHALLYLKRSQQSENMLVF